jgi:hypothetical protein
VENYGLRPINTLILFRIRKNCLIGGRSLLSYKFAKKDDETDSSNCRGISLLSNSYKTLSHNLSRLRPHKDKIIWDHQCGFGRNRSTADQIFCIRQILEEKWEYNETLFKLLTDFKKASDSVIREVLYNILTEFGVTVK